MKKTAFLKILLGFVSSATQLLRLNTKSCGVTKNEGTLK